MNIFQILTISSNLKNPNLIAKYLSDNIIFLNLDNLALIAEYLSGQDDAFEFEYS